MTSTIKIKIQKKVQNNTTEGENNEQEQEQEQAQEQEQEQKNDETVFKQWKQRPSEPILAALFKAAREGEGDGEGAREEKKHQSQYTPSCRYPNGLCLYLFKFNLHQRAFVQCPSIARPVRPAAR